MNQELLFKRPHHQVIAKLLSWLDGQTLKSHNCYFAGGTAIAMSFGEFRTSRDVDFLVGEHNGFKDLKKKISSSGLEILFKPGFESMLSFRKISIDQYGIRLLVLIEGLEIKFEIIAHDQLVIDSGKELVKIHDIELASTNYLIASKLLANSDRFPDRSTFNRDVIDLSFMGIKEISQTKGFDLAVNAIGVSTTSALNKSIDQLVSDINWLQRCIENLEIHSAPAAMIKNLNNLRIS